MLPTPPLPDAAFEFELELTDANWPLLARPVALPGETEETRRLSPSSMGSIGGVMLSMKVLSFLVISASSVSAVAAAG